MRKDDIQKGLLYLEQELGLGSGFLINLWGEQNAWTFVIKAHALLETALSELLEARLLTPKLKDVIDFLPMGGRTGKVSFLRAAGLLSPTDQAFLDEFQKLRNDLVHSVHNTRFDFQTYLTTNPSNAKRLGKSAAGFGGTDEVRQRYEAHFQSDPRHIIWLAVLSLLARSRSVLIKTTDQRRRIEQGVARLFDR